MSEQRNFYRRGSLVWPVVLIGLGVIFLLNNLGILSWDIWMTIIRLWPLLLVAVGLDILFGRRSGVWAAITVFLIVGLFAGGTWLVQTTGSIWSGETSTQKISHPLKDSSSAVIDINFGVGELEMGKISDLNTLLEGVLDITEDETLKQDLYFDDETAYLELSSTGTQFYPSTLFRDWEKDSRNWTINLSETVPIDLEIDTGAGRSEIDLTGINLIELNVDSGVGETVVYLPDSGDFNAWVSLGVGELVVYVPEDLNVRIHMDTGIGNNSISGDYLQAGSVYYSPGFEDSEDQVELYVDGGIGEVRVIQNQR
jgi:hypothetical protein